MIERHSSSSQAEAAIITALREIPVALLSDQLRRNRGSRDLRPYHRPAPLVGTAVTVRTRAGDNLAILRAYDVCRPGDVMVVDGAIRDVAEIAEREFPVYARGVNHRGPYKDGPGAINVPISVGGMAVRPGDIIVGDQDGLVAFSPDEAPEVIRKALLQQKKEEDTIQAIREVAGIAPSWIRWKRAA
jgi:regulator of RNase E activity RraA